MQLQEAKDHIIHQNPAGIDGLAVPSAAVNLPVNAGNAYATAANSQSLYNKPNKPTQLESLLKSKTPPQIGPSDHSSLANINTALSMPNSFNSNGRRLPHSSNNLTVTTVASSMPMTTSLTSTSMSTVSNTSSPSPFVSGPSILSASSNSTFQENHQDSNVSSSLSLISNQVSSSE